MRHEQQTEYDDQDEDEHAFEHVERGRGIFIGVILGVIVWIVFLILAVKAVS